MGDNKREEYQEKSIQEVVILATMKKIFLWSNNAALRVTSTFTKVTLCVISSQVWCSSTFLHRQQWGEWWFQPLVSPKCISNVWCSSQESGASAGGQWYILEVRWSDEVKFEILFGNHLGLRLSEHGRDNLYISNINAELRMFCLKMSNLAAYVFWGKALLILATHGQSTFCTCHNIDNVLLIMKFKVLQSWIWWWGRMPNRRGRPRCILSELPWWSNQIKIPSWHWKPWLSA